MLVTKKKTEPKPTFVPGKNFLKLDEGLLKQFDTRAFALLANKDRRLPDIADEFVMGLIQRTETMELVEFAYIHNQMRLYRTLQEFIRLNVYRVKLADELVELFIDIATQFLTQAYCIYHEPNNMRHMNNYWAYRRCLDLCCLFRPFEGSRKSAATDSSGAAATTRECQYEN